MGGAPGGGDASARSGGPGRRPGGLRVSPRAALPAIVARRERPAARDPHPRRPPPRRRAVRLRPVQGPARGGRRPGRGGRRVPGHLPPPGPACSSWSAGCATGWPSCSPCPTATRSCSATAAPPRSGTPPSFGAGRASAASTSCSASSRRSSPRSPAGPPPRRARRCIAADPGTAPRPLAAVDGVDAYALTHNETSTGVAMPPSRPEGADAERAGRSSTPPRPPAACASTRPRSTSTTSPPRSAWPPTAGCGSPPARPPPIERIERIAASDRWIPASLDLGIALDNSRKDQTYNTPALATMFLAVQQIEWVNENGGLDVGRRPLRPVGRRSSTAGPRPPTTPPRS